MGDDELQEMIDEADRDGDGEINEEEFIRIMKKTNLFWDFDNSEFYLPNLYRLIIAYHISRNINLFLMGEKRVML